MILAALLLVPLLAAPVAWAAGRVGPRAARAVAAAAVAVDLALALALCGRAPVDGRWLARLEAPWIEGLGVGIRLGVDGLSLLLVLLTVALGAVAVAVSWRRPRERVGAYHMHLLLVLAGTLGVFLALDLLLFVFFFELMLVPMAFLIAVWGHEERVSAAIKFFLFSQAGGLALLVSVVGLAVAHRAAGGELTFAYEALLGTPLDPALGRWLFAGFFLAFAIKLPMVPLHPWLPDAHTQAPTAGSVLLAGLLLKTGAYGLLRFAVPLFPRAAAEMAPLAVALGVVGILYGGGLAFAQSDLKRLVAYTSVAHLGFVLVGVFTWSRLALQGAVLQMICHGLATGALFVIAGALDERLGTRDLGRMGALARELPRMGAAATFFAMASLGLPGLGTFVAEVLVLIGAFRVAPGWTAVAALGLVVATVYSLALLQRAFHGRPGGEGSGRRLELEGRDLDGRELAVLGAMAAALVVIGLWPQPLIDSAEAGLAAAAAAVEAGAPGGLW